MVTLLQVAPRHLSDMASSGHLMLLALALLATTGAQARKAASRSLKQTDASLCTQPCCDKTLAEACIAAGHPLATAAAVPQQHPSDLATRRSLLLGSPLLFSTTAPAGAVAGSLPPDDDGSSNSITLPGSFTLFGTARSSLFVNNNGGVSFNSGRSSFTPDSLIQNSQNGIAMFYAYYGDVDTRGTGTVSWYSTQNAGVLGTARTLIGSVALLDWAFIATWSEVGYYNAQTNKKNTFQLLLANAADGQAYLCYLYAKLEWTTGSASGGTDGLGGFPARAGYSDGAGQALELSGSGSSNVMTSLVTQYNGGRAPGRYCYPISTTITTACSVNNGACDPLTTCTNSVNGPVCGACPAGYTGTGSTGCVRINPCASNPCQHGGVCSASGSTFTCDCSGTTDFTGDRCETRINNCANHQCQNGGQCVDGDRSYTCECLDTTDFEGAYCETQIDDCANHQCQHGAKCVDGDRSYTCDCSGTTDYVGEFCETRIDDCSPNPCKNGGTCIDEDRAFTCTCPSTCFSGFTCGLLNFAGFYRPVVNLPAANTIRAGQAVPIKFGLGCNMGTAIFAPGFPSYATVPCDVDLSTYTPTGLKPASNPGSSDLSYEAGTATYNYVWKTPSSADANTCQVLLLRFVDGTERRVAFRYRK